MAHEGLTPTNIQSTIFKLVDDLYKSGNSSELFSISFNEERVGEKVYKVKYKQTNELSFVTSHSGIWGVTPSTNITFSEIIELLTEEVREAKIKNILNE